MKPCGLALRSVCPPVLLLLAAAAVLGRPPLERTLFKNIPRTDPAREVIRTVLGSRFYSMRDGFAASDWAGLGYGGAWERAKRYFPGSIYFVRPGTYFMTHGHDADGRLFMEVHESAYLTLCLENRRTFTPAAIVRDYGRMFGAANAREAVAFRDKTGRLEAYFRDEKSNRRLRKALGDPLYLRLIEELREEDYHMLAGGLMHEGLHAGMDDALVARVQAEFATGRRAVQWDEMRAFMAEIGYHGAFCRWAVEDIAGQWRQIEGLRGELEKLRKKPALSAEADEARFEQTRVRAWTYAALVRLRMRELWQSVRRTEDLSRSFKKDYVRDTAPPDLAELLSKLEHDAAGLVAASGEAIQATELAARSLEEVLDVWGAWASGRRPFPPPVTDSQAIFRQVKGIGWPDPAPAAAGAAALMKRAGEALEKERTSS
jgi:hypothetical protein